jgi:hypothetical protein
MGTVCACGADCADFMHQHGIQSNAIFACPVCETSLVAHRSGVSGLTDPAELQSGHRGLSGDEGTLGL